MQAKWNQEAKGNVQLQPTAYTGQGKEINSKVAFAELAPVELEQLINYFRASSPRLSAVWWAYQEVKARTTRQYQGRYLGRYLPAKQYQNW